jgi:hypothetical protein
LYQRIAIASLDPTPGMAMRYQIAAQERDAKIAEAMSKLAGQ